MNVTLILSGIRIEIAVVGDDVSISVDDSEAAHFNYIETLLIARSLITAAAELKERNSGPRH